MGVWREKKKKRRDPTLQAFPSNDKLQQEEAFTYFEAKAYWLESDIKQWFPKKKKGDCREG